MDILRNLFGNVTAGIIRLLVTVGILVAVYLLFVKPALHTTEKISHEVNGSINQSLQQTNLGDIDKTIEDVNRKVQREIRHSFHISKHHGNANELVVCIQRAHQKVAKIQRCTEKY
jgi:hypothetical protein